MKHTGQTYETIEEALERDNFMTADEAKEFGLVDKVIDKRAEEPAAKPVTRACGNIGACHRRRSATARLRGRKTRFCALRQAESSAFVLVFSWQSSNAGVISVTSPVPRREITVLSRVAAPPISEFLIVG